MSSICFYCVVLLLYYVASIFIRYFFLINLFFVFFLFFFLFFFFFFFFFFQAEDGIRDHCVTGVQTCALPISVDGHGVRWRCWADLTDQQRPRGTREDRLAALRTAQPLGQIQPRSEERRVGKEWRDRREQEQ